MILVQSRCFDFTETDMYPNCFTLVFLNSFIKMAKDKHCAGWYALLAIFRVAFILMTSTALA